MFSKLELQRLDFLLAVYKNEINKNIAAVSKNHGENSKVVRAYFTILSEVVLLGAKANRELGKLEAKAIQIAKADNDNIFVIV